MKARRYAHAALNGAMPYLPIDADAGPGNLRIWVGASGGGSIMHDEPPSGVAGRGHRGNPGREALRMNTKLITPLVTLILAGGAGCAPEYCPIIERSPLDRAEYRCDITCKGEVYHSTLSKRPGHRNGGLRLRGKAQCLAISGNGDVVAIAIRPMAGPNVHGHLWLANTCKMVFVDARTLQVIRRWRIEPPGMPPPDRDGYVRSIHNLDRMAISEDGKTIATFYWRPCTYRAWGPVVAVWQVTTGRPLRELSIPRAPGEPPSGERRGVGACALGFSPGSELVAFSGGWGCGKYSPPDCFLVVWRTSDGLPVMLRPVGHLFLRGLCFDRTGKRLACWHWAGWGTSQAKVMVWSVSEGKLLVTKRVRGRVLGITRTEAGDAFEVALADGRDLHIRWP